MWLQISDTFSPRNPVADGFFENRGVFVLAMTQLSGRVLGPAITPAGLRANLANAVSNRSVSVCFAM